MYTGHYNILSMYVCMYVRNLSVDKVSATCRIEATACAHKTDSIRYVYLHTYYVV